jgi:hypothetical protein
MMFMTEICLEGRLLMLLSLNRFFDEREIELYCVKLIIIIIIGGIKHLE